MNNQDLEKKAAQVRIDTLKAIHNAGSGHTGSCMSVVEILVSLYYGNLGTRPAMMYDPAKPGCDEQDYLVLSKSHAAPALYAVLSDLGFFDKSELDFLRQINALLQGYPVNKIPGVTASVPFPGQGLSVGVGLALSLKMDRKNNRVFTVMGDGELQCGQVWEAAMSAAHYNLNNLVTLIDNNKLQREGLVKSVMDVEPIQDKFEAFGWKVIQVSNGHDFDQILNALVRALTETRKPVCIWCHTVKGKGIEFAERKPGYHGVALSDSEISEALPKLEAIIKEYE